jgi:predicted ribosomally synthesized peptide with nif11-like leader
MSIEQAKAFIEKLDNDKTFLKEVAGAGSDETRMELAKTAGFDFSAEEFASAMAEATGAELSDEELDSVAGGYLKITMTNFKNLSRKYTEVEWT